ncbi:MAG TPA: TetR family transcriptional regulator [Roseiflexaceae bacterium]|nr:TetR family transcriptional regulator [Roseiflexaceae bacterium]
MRAGSTARPRRPRNAVATRAAILAAARAGFGRDSYEHVGVRDIAAVAGVDAALVIRYFGSKERLFVEAVSQEFSLDSLLDGEREQFGERLARYMLEKGQTPGAFDPLMALLRSATNEQAAGLLRSVLEQQFIEPLARWLGGEQATERAALIVAYMIGLSVTREMLRVEPLSAPAAELLPLAAATLQGYVDMAPAL